jgi:small conductance mechanosensitive channel
VIDVPVARDSDLATASAAITAAASELSDDPDVRNDIIGPPRVLGVQEVLDDRILLRLAVRTRPGARLGVQREIRAHLIEAARDGRFDAPTPAVASPAVASPAVASPPEPA